MLIANDYKIYNVKDYKHLEIASLKNYVIDA